MKEEAEPKTESAPSKTVDASASTAVGMETDEIESTNEIESEIESTSTSTNSNTRRRPRRSRTVAKEAMEAISKATTNPSTKAKGLKKDNKGGGGNNTNNNTGEAMSKLSASKQEAIDALNIGRLVEQNKHVMGTGQFYPHHGRILELLPQQGRIPDRWVVEWEDPNDPNNQNGRNVADRSDDVDVDVDVDINSNSNSNSNSIILRRDEWTRGDLEEHDALVEAWQNPFRVYNGRRPDKTRLGQPLKNALEKVRERYHKVVVRDIEHESFGVYSSCGTKGRASQNDNEEDTGEAAGDLLPTLVLMAALEDALQTSLQYQRTREMEKRRAEGSETAPAADATKTAKKTAADLNSHPPLYYTSNPTQYLIAPSRAADAEEDMMLLAASKNPKAVVTPAILAQRVRDGCQWAYNYIQQQETEKEEDDDNDNYNGNDNDKPKQLDAPSHSSISATAMELDTKKAREASLFPKDDSNTNGNANGDAYANSGANPVSPEKDTAGNDTAYEQRRSIRSGLGERGQLFDPTEDGGAGGARGRRSTRGSSRGVSYNYAESSFTPEPNPVQKGGRVALWWLKTMEENAKKQAQEKRGGNNEEEEGDGVDNVDADDNDKDNGNDKDNDNDNNDVEMEDTEANTKTKAVDKTEAAAASNIITGDSYDDAMGGAVADEEEDNATKATDDEDFDVSKANDGDDSDDQLENVEKERSLTPIPDLPGSDEEDDQVDEEEDSDGSDEEEEEIDEEHAIVWDNPYLTPSVPAILEYLSKPKSISGEDVQKAMDDITLRLRHNKRTTSYGLPVSSLEVCDKAVLNWENPDHPQTGNLVLKCVSGETVNELQRLDSQTFGRCKFELEIIGATEKTIQIRNREDFEQRSEEYKVRKHNDRWRFKGIHEGHAHWPSWKDEAKRWIESNVAKANGKSNYQQQHHQQQQQQLTSAAQAEDDEALAKRLAEEAAKEAEADTSSASRRTGRRSRSSRGGGAGADGVFYGNQSSMTQKQLMDALIRLVKAQGHNGSTLYQLQQLVSDDSSDPLRRIRIALGKLLWKRNLLAKLHVASKGSDQKLLKHLDSGKHLLKLEAPKETEATSSTTATTSATKSSPGGETGEASDLLDYLSHLHRTEITLRNLLLKQIGRIPLPVIATAADERPGTLENMDAPDFEEANNIEWKTTGSDLLRTLVYRPGIESTLGDEHTPCYWYEIRDWSDSIASEAEDAEDDAKERRKRFRAVPHGQQHDNKTLLLTEAQVHAGKKAAELKREQERDESASGWASNPFASEIGDRITLIALDDEENPNNSGDNNGNGNNNYNNNDNDNDKAPAEISGRVVGHDSIVDADDDSGDVEYRILILPEVSEGSGNGTSSSTSTTNLLASPFWAVLDVRADDASYVCKPEGQSKWYSIENQDYHVDSEPYKACQGVIEWLSRQSKAMPFMEPVDPVALGIPTYPDVVKHPMDISTMTEKLENGAYSNIPPSQLVGNSLICRMLNGPFRKDLELIFDNAMLFNPPDDWIAQAAAALKKSIGKKIDTLAYAAEKKHSSGAGSGNQRKSIYADEDSDVDMYEYESDNDEEYVTGSSRRSGKRKRSGATSRAASNKDEAAARPMENPIKLQIYLKDGNDLRGRFSGLPLNGYASTYSMPPQWSCRKATTNGDAAMSASKAEQETEANDEEHEDQEESEYVQEMADLLALHKRFGEAETSNLRRSSRETRPTPGRRSNRDKKKEISKKSEGLEYYLRDTNSNSNSNSSNTESGEETKIPSSFSSIPSSRLDVEILLEKRHEDYYAKLYRDYESSLISSGDSSSSSGDWSNNENSSGEGQRPQPSDNGFALYSTGSFPPYLGRVVPSKNQHGSSWEIRPPFVVPALRWVLRGLIASGHLTAIESMYGGNSGSSGYDVTSGIVLSNDVYYWNPEAVPFEILDTRVLQRKKRAGKSDDDSSEDEVEMSEYEKLRAERVARNAERLKALGLA